MQRMQSREAEPFEKVTKEWAEERHPHLIKEVTASAQLVTKTDMAKQLDDWEETRFKPFIDYAIREIFTKPKTARTVSGCNIRDP